tara:strand:- start:1492 stop:1731 length:240 start_codon:yes stop_codon:yes gene_type:complete
MDEAKWFAVDEGALRKRVVDVIIQVNGKLRGRIQAPPGVSKDDLSLRARELENVEKFLREEKITRIIHVPDKLLNFVIS